MNYAVKTEGDTGFIGVDAQSLPRLVSAGLASDARNKDFRNKTAATRRGMCTALFATARTMSFDNYSMPYSFDGYAGFGTIYGSGIFSNPEGYEYGMLAVARGTWLIQNNSEPFLIPLPVDDAGISGPVVLKQAFNVVLMFRGEDLDALVCDPVNDERWATATQTYVRNSDADNSWGDGTEPIPNGNFVTVLNNRAYVGVGRSEQAVSDILDYTRYSRTSQRFYLNEGSDDYQVTSLPYNETTLIVFKNQSVYLLQNLYGSLENVVGNLLTGERGCIAAGTPVSTGKDVWFLSEGGVYSIGQALDNKLQAGADPVSKPMEPYFRRINWSAAVRAQAVIHDNKYYLAVPLDGAQYNNALLVYDFLTAQWAAIWSHDYLDVQSFLRMSSPDGKRDLYIVTGDSLADATVHGTVWRMNDGLEDRLFNAGFPVEDMLLSRGYGPVSGSGKSLYLEVEQETWNPEFTIELIADGVNEVQVLESGTLKPRDETYIFDGAAPDVLNASGLHGASYRKDYSVLLPGDSALDLDDFDFDGYVFQAGLMDGANPQLHQAARERYAVANDDRSVQVRISNAAGRAVQRGIVVEQATGRVSTGTQV